MADPIITVNKLPLSGVPTQNQVATVQYKKKVDPDTSFVTVTTTQTILPDGTLSPALIIDDSLEFATVYTVRAFNNCEGLPVDKDFTTPAVTCPSITDIIGTAT